MMWKRFLGMAAIAFGAFSAQGVDFTSEVRIHCEQDTVIVVKMLKELSSMKGSMRDRAIAAADALEGTPYVPGTLEGETEQLTIRLDGLDCVTFVDNVLALAKASGRSNPTWRNFADDLENLRYRKGKIGGYQSRLHYTSDWIAENVYRGNIKEITEDLPGAKSVRMTLDYMTRNLEKYPALKDPKVLEDIRMVEMGYRAHKVPYLPKEAITKKDVAGELKDGDIIVIVSRETGLDASHVGFIRMKNGVPYLLHASSAGGKVTLEAQNLNHYFKHRGRNARGFRILRIAE